MPWKKTLYVLKRDAKKVNYFRIIDQDGKRNPETQKLSLGAWLSVAEHTSCIVDCS